MYPHPPRGGSGGGPPSQGSASGYGRQPSASQSPEQSRTSIGRPGHPMSPNAGGGNNDEGWYHRSGNSGGPPPAEMREVHYPGQHHPPLPPPVRFNNRERDENMGRGNAPQWLDDRYASGGPPRHQMQRPPPPSSNPSASSQQQQQANADDRYGPRSIGAYSGAAQPSQSQPAQSSYHQSHSPSHRPRTPPRIGGGGVGRPGGQSNPRQPPPWDAPQPQAPMSAPPSMVPRIPPGASAATSHSQQTSPSLPAFSSRAGSEGRGHARVPSWGAHSSRESPGVGSHALNNIAAPSGAPISPPRHMGGGGNMTSRAVPSYRGGSVDTHGRQDEASHASVVRGGASLEQNRKRPASESPPNSMSAPPPPTQNSPSQRGDVMSMSSILGPSGGRSSVTPTPQQPEPTSADKRRRLDGSGRGASASPYKQESGPSATMHPTSSASAAASAHASAAADAAAANLARRKWSGPIAEEAAQQAAAWRAQEQRWGGGGSTRSPKVALVPLGGGAGSGNATGQERNTSPFPFPGPRGVSPSVSSSDGHRRQRSDGVAQAMTGNGQPIDGRSPLGRHTPLHRGTGTPPPGPGAHGGRQQMKQAGPPPPQQHLPPHPPPPQQQQSMMYAQPGPPPPHAYYRGPSPPPPPPMQHMSQQYPGQMVHPQQQVYPQPSYHAYDNQGRPVEIDVEEVRGGAFAGHGSHPNAMQAQQQQQQHMGQVMPSYEEKPSMRGRQINQAGPKHHRDDSAGVSINGSKASVRNSTPGLSGRPLPAQQVQARDRSDGNAMRRSVTPVMPGPAVDLLPARRGASRVISDGDRPSVSSKDFNAGPKVDSEAVWSALTDTDSAANGTLVWHKDNEQNDDFTRPIGRHLGSFLYDTQVSALLPGDLLRRNVGATLEVRVPGRWLGVGPTSAHANAKHDLQRGRWALGRRDGTDADVNSDEAWSEHCDADANAFWDKDVMLQRRAWGTDVYTDDSDVVMMCLHSGWLQGPQTDDVPAWVPPGKAVKAWRRMTDELEGRPSNGAVELSSNRVAVEARSRRLEQTMDVSVILRVAPKLIAYKGSQRGGVKSRSWGNTHDGVSLTVVSATLKPPGYASGERGLRSMKQRIDQMARLKMLATIAGDVTLPTPPTSLEDVAMDEDSGPVMSKVKPRERLLAGGLLDILAAAQLKASEDVNTTDTKRFFWQIDPKTDVIKAA